MADLKGDIPKIMLNFMVSNLAANEEILQGKLLNEVKAAFPV